MMILILINHNGTASRFDETDPLRVVLDYIKHNNIETVVAGEFLNNGAIDWEEQFKLALVMPGEFGKLRQS
jgi:hypothetical protein